MIFYNIYLKISKKIKVYMSG